MKGSRTLFEFKLGIGIEDLIQILKAFNNNKDNFSCPLWEIEILPKTQEDFLSVKRITLMGYLFERPQNEPAKKTPTGAFGELSLNQITENQSIITGTCFQTEYSWALLYFYRLIQWLKSENYQDIYIADLLIKRRKVGPTMQTQIMFNFLKDLKDNHPKWTQNKLAMEAKELTGEKITVYTVKNIYRAVGEKWIKGERSH